VPYIGAKLEWLDTFLAEQLYLIIPICYRSGPIGSGTLATLLVDVKILSHHEPGYFSAFGTVVSKHALISVTLGDPRQFFVPFHLLHVSGGRLGAWFSTSFAAVRDLASQFVMHPYDLLPVLIGNATAQNCSTLVSKALIRIAHCVLFCDGAIIKLSLDGRCDHCQHKQPHC